MSRLKQRIDSVFDAIERYKFQARWASGRLKPVTVIIPTINSARYLDITLEYYRRMDVSPVIFVDAKTADQTFQLASRLCQHVHLLENSYEWVESLIERISRSVATEWALRVDDDELPSRAVLEMCKHGMPETAHSIVSLPRMNCGLTQSGQFAHNRRARDRQFRLYRVNDVQYITAIHTPGFIVQRSLQLAHPHFLLHFDWAVRNYEERKAKVDRYNRVGGSAAGDRYRTAILFEENPKFRAQLLKAPEFTEVAKALAQRFPQSCVL
jgi:glycosyltransferase involved in cell wall biosynthesis